MQLAFQVCALLVGLPLQLAVIAALLRGAYRRYPFVLLYVIVDFLTTALEIRPSLAYRTATTPEMKRSFATLYWWDERIIQAVVFLMVITLVYRATAQFRPRRVLLLGVVAVTASFAAVTFFIHFDPTLPSWDWMTPWTRDLNFGAAILDLGLWAALIGARDKDYTLLMVAGAMGIQFTGGAIGQAARNMSPAAHMVMGDFIALANLACLYIWWHAFRLPEKVRSKVRARPGSEPAGIHGSSPE